MFRQMLATLVTATLLLAAPAVLLPSVSSPLTVAATTAVTAQAADDDDKGAAKKRRIPHNKKVGMNMTTKVFHDKTCRHFSKKLEIMTAKEAKAKGGKPCGTCLK